MEADRSRADDYYLAEGTGLAARYVADIVDAVARASAGLDGRTYERWVAGYDVETGAAKGRLRSRRPGVAVRRGRGQRPEDLVAGRRAAPGDRRGVRRRPEPRGGVEIIGWVAEHATTRVGSAGPAGAGAGGAGSRPRWCGTTPPGPVTRTGICTCRSTPGSSPPARGAGCTRSGCVDIDRGHQRDRACRGDVRPGVPGRPRRARLHPGSEDGEVDELAPYAGAFSARAAQISRNIARYEAAWRREHPDEEPGPRLRRSWDRRAWAEARPDKVVPTDGAELVEQLGRGAARPRVHPADVPSTVPVPCRRRRSGGWTATRSRPGADPSRCATVGLERRATSAARSSSSIASGRRRR